MKRDWPLMLIAAALLLGAAAQTATEGNIDVLGGALLALGSVCVGAWLIDAPQGRSNRDKDGE